MQDKYFLRLFHVVKAEPKNIKKKPLFQVSLPLSLPLFTCFHLSSPFFYPHLLAFAYLFWPNDIHLPCSPLPASSNKSFYFFIFYFLLFVFYNFSLLRHLSKHLAKWETKPLKSLKYRLSQASPILIINDSFFQELISPKFALDNGSELFNRIQFGRIWREIKILISSRIDVLAYVS